MDFFQRYQQRIQKASESRRRKKESKMHANNRINKFRMISKKKSINLIDVENKVQSLKTYVLLPQELLNEIFTYITGDKWPTIFQNPLVITKEICNAGLISWDFQLASIKALKLFGDLYGNNYMNSKSINWDSLFQNPTNLTVNELRRISTMLNIWARRSFNKAQLILNIYNKLNLSAPKIGSNSNLLLAFYNENKYLHNGLYKALYLRLIKYDRSYVCLTISETREKILKNFTSIEELYKKLKEKEVELEVKNAEIEMNNDESLGVNQSFD